MAYLIPIQHFCMAKESGRQFCKATAVLRLVDTWGDFRGEFCRQHAGAELARLDAVEKLSRQGGGRQA